MPSSYYLADRIVETFFKGGTTELYIGLFLSPLSRNGGGTEVSVPSYSRKKIKLSTPLNGITSNEESVTFNQATEDWGLVTNYGIFDDNGTLLFFGDLLYNDTVNTGETITIPALQLQLSIV